MESKVSVEVVVRDKVGGAAYLESWLTSTESTSTCRLFAEIVKRNEGVNRFSKGTAMEWKKELQCVPADS
jgi:hypothetical protein